MKDMYKNQHKCICGLTSDNVHVLAAHKRRCQKWISFKLELRDDHKILEDIKSGGLAHVANELGLSYYELRDIMRKIPRPTRKKQGKTELGIGVVTEVSPEQILRAISSMVNELDECREKIRFLNDRASELNNRVVELGKKIDILEMEKKHLNEKLLQPIKLRIESEQIAQSRQDRDF